MKFWDFMKKRRGERTPFENSLVPPALEPARKPEKKEKEYTLSLLYEFLDDNYEVKGYLDALLCPETWFMEQNLEFLKNEFYRMIIRVKFRYEGYISEADFLLQSRMKARKTDTLEEMLLKKKKAEDQLTRVLEIEKSMEKGIGESQSYVFSYIRGFQKGLAALRYYSLVEYKE